MEIKLGTIGFCSGVERTVETAKETAAKNNYGGVYILKPLVHNKIVMAELKGCGISLKDLGSICCCDIVIIGAHGTSSSSYLTLKEKNAEIIDTTCPVVKTLYDKAKELATNGYKILVFGDKDHVEVKNILRDTEALAPSFVEGDLLEKIHQYSKVGIVSQTTQYYSDFREFVTKTLNNRSDTGPKIHSVDTICKEVKKRQEEAENFREHCDTILVVGDQESANSRRLYKIVSRKQINSHFIEDVGGLERSWFKGAQCLGILCGTSTPSRVVTEIVNNLKLD